MFAPSPVAFQLIRCPQCSTALTAESWAETGVLCPNCLSHLSGRIFPAFSRQVPAGLASPERVIEGEAACFFHPETKAAHCCQGCGRFVCDLCDIPMGARHLCPGCVGSGIEKSKLPELVTRRTCWSRLAFFIGGFSLLCGWPLWPATFLICGPLAIILVLYGWSKPQSLVRGKSPVLAGFAILFGLAELAVLCGMVVMIWKAIPHA